MLDADANTYVVARRFWPLIAFAALVSSATGLVLLLWSGINIDGAAWLLGVQLVVNGIVSLAVWFVVTDPGLRSLIPIGWSLALVVGLVAWIPAVRVTDFFALLIGFYWLVWGFSEVGGNVQRHGPLRFYRITAGGLAIAGGAAIVSAWNDPIRTLAVLAGAYLVVRGVAEAWLALHTRRLGASG